MRPRLSVQPLFLSTVLFVSIFVEPFFFGLLLLGFGFTARLTVRLSCCVLGAYDHLIGKGRFPALQY